MRILHRFLLIAIFAIWFGGFTFYISVVVPIGTEVLGSSRSQGFITQQVTDVLNWIGGFAVAVLFSDWIFSVNRRSRKLNVWLFAIIAGIAALWVVLLVVHPMLDRLLEPEHEYVRDENHFYQLHRLYLWASTIQWLLCWCWLPLIIIDWTKTSDRELRS